MSNINSRKSSLPPKWVVGTIRGLREALGVIKDKMFPGEVVLYEKFENFYLIPPLFVAAELDIASLLQNGEKPVAILARETQTDEESLYRILRVLSSHGIFTERGTRLFSNTRLSKPLIEGPRSLRHLLRHHLGELNWQITGDLLTTVKTGKDGFTRRFGKTIYDYLSEDQYGSTLCDQSMSDLSSLAMEPLLQAYPFSDIPTLADIGGGDGSLLIGILRKYPSIRGILFDLPAALEKSHETLPEFVTEQRIIKVAGNFLNSVPEGADGYLLKNVLHNWDDEHCIHILSNIRDVLPQHGKVIILEMIVPPGNSRSTAKMIDIQMLATMPGGRERTREEFEALLLRSGLCLNRIYSTIAPISVLEAKLNR